VFAGVEDALAAGLDPDLPASGGDAWRNVHGVCLTLLLDGQVLARTQAMLPAAAALDVDAAAASRLGSKAAADLWRSLEATFAPAKGLTTEPQRRAMLGSLALSVELAGEPTPLLIDELAQTDVEVAPGLDGVGVVTPTGVSEWAFPLRQLSLGQSPADALSSSVTRAMSDASAGVLPARTLRTERGLTLLKFPVMHAVRSGPGEAPRLLYRAQATVDASRMTYVELRAAAARTAQHLRRRLEGSARGELGVYVPMTGQSTPPSDPDLALHLTLAALLEHARVTRADAGDLVARWLAEAAAPRERSHAGVAAAVIAGHCAARVANDPDMRARVQERIGALAPRLTLAFSIDKGFAPEVPVAARGLVACALVRAAATSPGAGGVATLELAKAAVTRTLVETPAGDLVGQMPWLGWGAQDLATLEGAREIASAPAMRTVRDRTWEHQLTALDAGADGIDLVGGVVFTKGLAVLPSWATARPVAFLASALADERLTTAQERPLQLARVVSALRFLRQLQADESGVWMYASRAGSIGGVRASPWDHRMPAEASVYTLFAMCRSVEALDAQVPAVGQQTSEKEGAKGR
jgi:hypothetical protein